MYDRHGSVMRRSNSRGSERLLTHHWHDGTTGIAPLDLAIQHQMDLGWNHHINRLMVIANLMNLCEIHPREVYEYFMTYYVDIPRGEWCDVVDGLYWRFVANNLNELRRNPRLAAFTSGLNRMADEKRQRIFSAAEAFLDRCTTSPN